MKIAVYSTHLFELSYLNDAFKNTHTLKLIEEELQENNTSLAGTCEAVMLFTSDKANAKVLTAFASLGIKFILLRSVGFDHVDLEKAKELGIRVANVPSYSPHAVAEHAVTLLMALNRKLIRSQELIKQQDFRLDGLTGFDVHSKTVGIVGLGKIGKVFSKIMNGFGCRLICYDPYPDPSSEKELNLKFVTFAELCTQSDIISIHCPLTPETNHLFEKQAFSLMKKGVFIVNTARGPIIKTEDLLSALDTGSMGGVGLDVYEFEKGLFFHDHRSDKIQDPSFEKLRSYPNVLITAHQAFLTETALKNIAETSLKNINCFEQGLSCENELQPKNPTPAKKETHI